MLNLLKYSVAFILIGFLMIYAFSWVLTLFPDEFLETGIISSLGNYGSFLSGIGTIVASIAAVTALDSWKKQLKVGKYIDALWDCKKENANLLQNHFLWHAQSIIENEYKNTDVVNSQITLLNATLQKTKHLLPRIKDDKEYNKLLNYIFTPIIDRAWLALTKELNSMDNVRLAELHKKFTIEIEKLTQHINDLELYITGNLLKKL